MITSQELYQKHGQEAYFFILKQVRDKNVANDIFQSSFLKIHKSVHQLNEDSKARGWIFQICRNEISNFFISETKHQTPADKQTVEDSSDSLSHICCFDRFIDELPPTYKEVIVQTYLKGKNQEEVAKNLKISLANVKARVRRSKAILRKRFQECCKFDVNSNGKLIGAPNCSICS